jgi:hypothetical protein
MKEFDDDTMLGTNILSINQEKILGGLEDVLFKTYKEMLRLKDQYGPNSPQVEAFATRIAATMEEVERKLEQ